MTQQQAEIIALQALAWLAESDDLLGVFMGATGASREDLRERTEDPEFLSSVLEFLTMDDQWVIGFCESTGLGFDQPLAARAALPGGAEVHWT